MAGTAHGTPMLVRSRVGKHWKMAETLGVGHSGDLVCVTGSSKSVQCHSSEARLLLCDTKWLDLKLYWFSSSFSLLRFQLKLVGQGPEGFGLKANALGKEMPREEIY